MPLFVPFLIGAGVLALTGYGGKRGHDGLSAMQHAKAIGVEAERRHGSHVRLVESARAHLAEQLRGLQSERLAFTRTTLARMVELLEALERRGNIRDVENVVRFRVQPEVVRQFVAQYLEAGGTLKGAVAATGAGAGASAVASGLVSAFATSSTGVAISGLSGAAAQSALLAWLGGGSIAAGGGGVALGSLMLGGIAVAPAVAIGGLVLTSQGEKALTRAEEYAADVNIAIAHMDALIAFHHRAEERTRELLEVTRAVAVRAERAIDKTFEIVEIFDGQSDEHVKKLSFAMMLSKALSELLRVRVLDDNGMLDTASAEVIARYRDFIRGV